MRKQARRLWFGDWQRHDELTPERVVGGPDDSDTVVITPVDDGDAKWRAERRRNIGRGAAGIAALAVLVALGFRLAGGDDAGPTPVTAQTPPAQVPQAQTPQAQPQVPQGAPGGFGGADLTGAAATKAAEAAVAKYPGDVERVTAGPGGGYVVHVIQPDGNEVHVLVDQGFKVQGSDANSGPRGFGSGTSQ